MKQFLLVIILAFPSLVSAQPPTLTFTPLDGATNVSVSNDLTITSDDALEKTDGTALSDSDLYTLIALVDDQLSPVVFTATISGNKKTITITPLSNLQDNTTYTLTIDPVQNGSGEATLTQSATFTTGDLNPPAIVSASAIDNTGSAFTFRVRSSEDATLYYVVDRSTTIPNYTQIGAGQNGASAPAEAFGSVAMLANTDTDITISGLDFSTPVKFNIYLFAEDAASNKSNITTRGIPLLNSSSIPAASVDGNELDLTVNIDEEPVTVHYVVTATSTPPTASQILAQVDAANGAPVTAGSFSYNSSGSAGSDMSYTITGLDDNTTYYVHFVGVDLGPSQTLVATETATTDDITPPQVVTFSPADNGMLAYNATKLIITFDENVANITTAADPSADDEHVIIKDAITNAEVTRIAREDIVDFGSATVEIPLTAGVLPPNKQYIVLIGNVVIEDVPADNDWGGISDPTVWNFSTSGVTINNITSDICAGSFQSIADITITEGAAGDFIADGPILLNLDNTSDFVYDISNVTVTAGPSGNTDITAINLNPKTFTSLTLNYTLDATQDQVDVITISGLKIYASAAGSTIIENGNSVTGKWAIDQPITFATINVGATATTPPQLLTPAANLLYCENEDISAEMVAVVNDPGTYKWYADESLSTFLGDGAEVAVESVLGIDPLMVGIVKRYVVRIDGCQSAPLEVSFEVAPVPVADAGPATASLCSGSSIALGGSPTLVAPSVAGPYQYFWSDDSPANFVDMGSNPTVSPTHGRDTTFQYTVRIVDANGCASDILDPNATISIAVDSTDEGIVYNSPLSTNFTLNSDPIALNATPSNSSSYSGNGVYVSGGQYFFDPDLAGTAGSPHAITYTTNLSNGCPFTEVRNFAVSNSSGSIINLANSYCSNEAPDPSKVLLLGNDWETYLEQDNQNYHRPNGYEYEFYDFQAYTNIGTVGPGVVYPTPTGSYPDQQHIDPTLLQPYQPGANYTYIGMRVRRHVFEVRGILGIIIVPESWDPPTFWNFQYINLFVVPQLKVTGLKSGQIVCDVDENYTLEASEIEGTYEISRNGVDYFTGPDVGINDSPPNSGKAIFNPHEAFIGTGFGLPPASGITDFYIRYTYVVPGTSGSNSSACEATLIIPFKISQNPTIAWQPFSQTEFCFEAANFNVLTNGRLAGETDRISGYGIFDNGNGSASFDPDEGLKAKAFATNNPPYTDYSTPENIVLAAIRTDANGCHTTINQTVQVRPRFPASFTASDLEVCYEDGTQNIVGGQTNGNYVLFHPDLTVNFAQTSINGFNLRTYFDNAVGNGADSTVNQKFDLTFNTFDPALGCSNSITKTFSVNPPIQMDISGMTSGMIVCGNGTPIELTGNQPNAGSFEISTTPGSGFVTNALGLNNTTSGKATFTPSGTGIPAGEPQKPFYIRYSFQGAGCTGTARTTETVVINPQPAISFAPAIPAPNTAYCFEQGSSPSTITLTTSQTTNVTLSGFGITDNGGGNATFNPTSAYQQSSLADNSNPTTDQTVRHMLVTARRTDAFSCSNTATVNYIVNPLPTATFSPSPIDFCFEDDAVTLSGAQTNVSYQYIYKNTTTPVNYSPAIVFQPTTVFDPEQLFNDAVSKGANALATLQFDVVYTAINSTTGCTHQKAPVTFTVSPRIPVEMAGIDEGDIFCSNVTDKEVVFTPDNGTFRLNGITEPFSNGKYLFDPQIDGPASGTNYVFTYTVITGNNCTNTQEKTIKVLPSPRALFTVDAMCDTALIAYDADASTNLASAIYTWTLSGEVKTGQNITHRFPGVSTYSVELVVRHPAYMDDPALVCSDSLRLDQIVGPYPDIEFEFFNVCEEDETNFEVITNNIPISTASWSFGDGENSSQGTLSDLITGLPKTSGTYQKPIHKYDGAADQIVVKVLGKTSEDFGGCETSYEKAISILKKWTPAPGALSYDMSQIDNGKGFWVVEDNHGNSSWEFSTAAKQRINTGEPAWVTGSVLPYPADDISYVNSPCFDLSSFTRPVLSMKHWTDTEPSDGAVLQYSVDGGETWQRLGNVSSGLDWYNRLTISSNPGQQTDLSSGWSLSDQIDWSVGKHTLDVLPTPRSKVRFRVAFSSFNNRENRDGFAFNNIVIEERNRTILVENFTNLLPSSQPNNEAYKAFKTINGNFNPNELVKLQYHHASAQAEDELNRDNPVDQNARAAFYGVTESVKAFVDGGFGQTSNNATFTSGPVLDSYFNLRSLVTSPINIAIDFDPEPADKLNVRATIQAINTISPADRYNVFIAIAEQSVSDQAYVLRKLLPDASGSALTSLSATDSPLEIIVSYDMRHVTRLPNGDFAPIAVIVFVQNLETKDVLQTAMRQQAATPSANIVTGMETAPENYMRLFPNPADQELTIILPAPARAETPLKVLDTFGKQVFEGVFKSGEHMKTIETKSLSTGVYLIQLSTPDGVVRKKAMVVHE